MGKHFLVGISDTETGGMQLFAKLCQLAHLLLTDACWLLAPDGSLHHHKLAERVNTLQVGPHDVKPLKRPENQDLWHFQL